MTRQVGEQNQGNGVGGAPMVHRKTVESVDIKKPMPTLPTGSTRMQEMLQKKEPGQSKRAKVVKSS